MTTEEKLFEIFEHIMNRKPSGFQKLIGDVNSGVCAVLRILYETDDSLSLGKISEKLEISEARVTALVKKMIKKGYIQKEKDKSDARVTNIRLTSSGKQAVENLISILTSNIAMVANEVGIDKLIAYLELTDEIEDAMKKLPPPPDIE